NGGRSTRLQGCPQCCLHGPCRPCLGNRGGTYDDEMCVQMRAWLRVRTHLPMLLSQVSWRDLPLVCGVPPLWVSKIQCWQGSNRANVSGLCLKADARRL